MMKFDAIFDRKHGSLYDRGAADSYYGRPRDPHRYPCLIALLNLT